MASRPPRRSPIAAPPIGEHYHQTTVGFLIGLSAAVIVSLLIWLVDSRSA